MNAIYVRFMLGRVLGHYYFTLASTTRLPSPAMIRCNSSLYASIQTSKIYIYVAYMCKIS